MSWNDLGIVSLQGRVPWIRRARRVAVNGFDGAWMDKNWNRTLKNSSAQSSDCVSRGAPLRVPFASCCWLHRQAASTVRALRKPRVKGTSNSNAWVRLKPTSPCWWQLEVVAANKKPGKWCGMASRRRVVAPYPRADWTLSFGTWRRHCVKRPNV